MPQLTMKILQAQIDALTARVALLEGVRPEPPAPSGHLLLDGFNTERHVGFGMLVKAMEAAGLTPVGVQRHGDLIVAALKRYYPDLDVYLSRSDAPVWPGFGSLDVTVDSGRGGWSFRPDGVTAWLPVGSR